MIKRYSAIEISKEVGPKPAVGTLEKFAASICDKKYILAADIAPLEAKVAMFDELVEAASKCVALPWAPWDAGLTAGPAIVLSHKTRLQDLLTRARAMEGK